jgi:tetratricopeptide (TPR) repeat protein
MTDTSTAARSSREILAAAMPRAQAGDFAGAQAIVEAGLGQADDPAPLHAFLGMLCARRGDLAAAAAHLAEAHRLRPDDVTIACNRIAVAIDLKDHEAALAVATMARAQADPSLRIARYRGFVAQELGQFEEAAEAYGFVLARTPGDFESWNNLGNAQSALGDFDGAIASLERAVALDPKAAPTRLNHALTLRSAGRAEAAEAALRDAARDFPADARPLHELYVLLKELGRHTEALETLESAAARDGGDMVVQLKLAIEYGLVMESDKAEQAYRRVLAGRPQEHLAYLGLAIHYEHANREDELAPLAALAEANGIEAGTRNFLSALEHRRAGRFEEALACLDQVPEDIEPERTAHLRATLLDRLGRVDEAFSWIEEAGRRHAGHASDPIGRAAELRAEVRGEIGRMTPEWARSWTPDVASPTNTPVFLLGFPRSGTTLLDTILMGHPDTVVLEEKPTLLVVDQEIGGFDALASMDAAAIEAARPRYFEEAARHANLAAGQMLVDKSPLYLYKLPLIRRLFPEARIVLSLRHPCDVLLSCLMSNFRLNRAMSNFLRLEDAAELYDLSFRHWETAQALFDMPAHRIVYERLVADVEAEVRPLFDWLGLDWRPEALDHTRTARARGLITTASYAQVTEPIYTRSAGRWQPYREHLRPILPILAPWAERFGYTL